MAFFRRDRLTESVQGFSQAPSTAKAVPLPPGGRHCSGACFWWTGLAERAQSFSQAPSTAKAVPLPPGGRL